MWWFIFGLTIISLTFVICLVFLLSISYLNDHTFEADSLISIIPVTENGDYLEFLINDLMRKVRRDKNIKQLHILLLNCGADEKNLMLCDCLCKRWRHIVVYCENMSVVDNLLKKLLIAKKCEV